MNEENNNNNLSITEENFTCDLLEKYINTGKNYIFSYPAGSGKTTAIRDYIVKGLQERKFLRKIIYVAPTQSLLDAMHQRLLSVTGILKTDIFNYHSNSEDYLNCKKSGGRIESVIKSKIDSASVILITHERMKFDVVHKFLCELDLMIGHKPLVFLDESIEDCNIVSTTSTTLDGILAQTGLIKPGETKENFNPQPNEIILNAKRLYEYFSRPARFDNKHNCKTIHYLSGYNLELANNVGFSDKAELIDPIVEARFLNLYMMIAMTIAQKRWIEDNDRVYLNMPIAIHEAWRNHAQIIIADATAFVHPSMCKDFELVLSSSWNGNLINQKIFAYKNNSRSKLNEGLGAITHYLNQINLRKYNNIYIVTFLGPIIKETLEYLKKTYPEYKIDYRDQATTEEFLASDIDNATDELYLDSTKNNKIIYLTNFGRTRGSNKFRQCDCVIQIGNYRMNPQILEYLKIIYPGIQGNQITLANYVQELYRGCIRCNKKMDAYAILDLDFSQYLEQHKYEFRFLFNRDSGNPFIDSIQNKIFKHSYGMNTELVKQLYNAKLNSIILHKNEIKNFCNDNRLTNARNKILNLYRKYPEIRNEIFDKFKSGNQLKQILTSKNSEDFDLVL